MMMVADPLTGRELEEESTVETAVGAEIDVLDDGRLAQPGLTQAAGEPLVLAAGRLAIDEQPEPILATEFVGIGGILQLEKGIGHGGEAERAQALTVGWISIASPRVSGSSRARECSRGSAAAARRGRRERARGGSSGWRRPRCRTGCRAPARGRRQRQPVRRHSA